MRDVRGVPQVDEGVPYRGAAEGRAWWQRRGEYIEAPNTSVQIRGAVWRQGFICQARSLDFILCQ